MTEEKIGDFRVKGAKDTFVERLQQASSELDSIKSSFSKGMDDLAKIQSILNLDGLSKMDGLIRSFEDRVSEAERRREEAVEGARRYSMELEKEKDRLVKLWDAYKNQEESLSMQEKHVAELEERLRDTEQNHMEFERDATARIRTLTEKLEETEQGIQEVEELRQQVMKFESIRSQLETNVDCMCRDLTAKDEVIRSLEKHVEELRGFERFEEFKTKFEEVSAEYEKEKERLTKLFRLYEETEAENKAIKEELREWQSWFDTNEDIFSRLFTSVEHLKHRHMTPASTISAAMVDEEIEIPPSLEERQDPEEKPKRKIRFRK
jgi:chromosome segregation ATPase